MKRKPNASNRLFALEQSLQNRRSADAKPEPKSEPKPAAKSEPKPAGQPPETSTGMAFDRNEAIALSYDQDSYAAAASAEDSAWTMALGSAAAAYEVDSFEVDSFEGEPVNHADAQSVPVTVIPQTAPQPHKSAQLASDTPNYTKAASEGDLWSADAEAFVADIQAILNGEKTYHPEPTQTIDTTATPASTPAPASTPPSPPPATDPPPPPPCRFRPDGQRRLCQFLRPGRLVSGATVRCL